VWVEFDRDRHEPLLTKGTRVRLRRLRGFGAIRGRWNQAEIRGTSGIRPFKYHVRSRLPFQFRITNGSRVVK
jgi:hypothetical protein